MKDDVKDNVGICTSRLRVRNRQLWAICWPRFPVWMAIWSAAVAAKRTSILRETIVGRLEQVRLQLSDVHHTLSRDIALAMDHAEALGRAETRLMGLMGKIKDAPVGYAGYFDAIKVKEEDLARIYAFDSEMLGHVDQIAADVDTLQDGRQSRRANRCGHQSS